jgi:Zn2+/Cd2+-exporting ATPase
MEERTMWVSKAKSWKKVWHRHGAVIVTLLCLIFTAFAWYSSQYGMTSLQIPFYLLAYMIGGYQKAWEGITTLVKERALDVDLLMVVAAVGAASIGYWMDGAMLIFIFSLSGTLAVYTMERTNKDIHSIMKLRPEEAVVLRAGREERTKIEALKKGDIVLVKPGERIPADGRVIHGYSAVNQSSITGESIPVDKSPNDEVFAGTINGQGALQMKVAKPTEATLLAKMIRLVQEAKSERPSSQLFMERFGRIYAKAVVASSALLLMLPPFLWNWSWDDTIYRAMIFLVVASPCALVSSIMPAVLSAISNGTRKGILFKGGIHLENIGNIKAVAFDKTGTLTAGEAKVTDMISFQQIAADELLRVTASLEMLSEHPIAKAIVQAANDKKLPLERASQLQAIPGLGIHGVLHGQPFQIGKMNLLQNISVTDDEKRKVEELENQGKTVIFVASQQQTLGVIALQDTLRPQAKEAVTSLKKMGIHVSLLTGDSTATAHTIAQQAGVDEVFAELLPEEKVEIVKRLKQQYGKVAMVGDGVNDAPALATATVGIAMGAAGTDVALETANVVLMADDIAKVAYAISLGKRTNRVIKQNLTFAIAVILMLVTGNFFKDINLPAGVIGHEGSTLAVILSGLRLLR